MILDNYFTENAASADVELVASDRYLGEEAEFTELSMTAMSEMHNLTLAMARVEHKCLVENDQSLMEGAVADFFKKAKETIIKWWNEFIAWLGSMYTKLKDVFIKREDWLKRNKAQILSATAEQLKDAKVSIGKKLFENEWASFPDQLIEEGRYIIAMASKLEAGDRSFKDKATEAMMKPYKEYSRGKSVSKAMHDSLIGESEEKALDTSFVKTLVGVAEATYKAMDKMKGAKIVAEAALSAVKGNAMMSEDKAVVNARLAALRDCGSEIQHSYAALSGILSTANSQAMAGLVKAASAAGKNKAASAAGKDPKKNESASLLDAYM
jgi:hypothetical protein